MTKGAPVETIVLSLDRETAIDLRDLIYGVGEHLAAGAPLPEFDGAASERLRVVLDELGGLGASIGGTPDGDT
jgi:hypothetical protein